MKTKTMSKPIIDIRVIRQQTRQRKKHADIVVEKGENSKDFWNFLNRDIKVMPSGIKDRIKEGFYTELATLFEAGMDVRSILELLAGEQKNKAAKTVFLNILDEVTRGASLSTALSNSGKFSRYEYYSIMIGEESGKLVVVLKDLALYFQKRIKQRRQIIGALTYPLVVLTVAFLAVGFMVGYVVPMFSTVFKRFGSDLPAITAFVIAGSAFFTASLKYMLLGLGLTIAFVFWQKDTPWFRKYAAMWILKIPVAGNIVHKVYLARFANTMALLCGAKMSLMQSIELTQKMVTFFPIESALNDIKNKVAEGWFFYKSIAEHSIFPGKMVAFVKAGEQVNQLELFFGRISDQYTAEIEYHTAMLSKLLEPLIIVVLGAVVSVILIAMYLPMFRMGQTI